MRLLCPFCQKPINVPDTEAGKAVNCPLCQQMFAAPYLHVAPPSSTAPTSGASDSPLATTQITNAEALAAPYALEAKASSPTTSHQPPPITPSPPFTPYERPAVNLSPEPTVAGLQHTKTLSFDIDIIRWIPAAAFGLIFILSFFSWVGSYPGGYPAYTQYGWQSLFANLSADEVADDEWKQKQALSDAVKSSWYLLPYFLLLLPACILAVAGPILTLTKPQLPPVVEQILHYRAVLLAVFAIFTMLALTLQWSRGFGLEQAVHSKVEEQLAEKKANANTPDKKQRYEMQYDSQVSAWCLRTTIWLRVVFFLHLVAAFAVAGEASLQLRGKKPAPRVGVMW
jgi:membrane protein implicated in regulation of membrane protease activity